MKKVAKHYFAHPSVWTYIVIAILIAFVCIQQSYFIEYWYCPLLTIVIAPFFEWFAHKYILHAQIGNVIEIPLEDGMKVGDKMGKEIFGHTHEVEVLKIKGDVAEIGYGWAKRMKAFRHFMHILHYGHHEDPNLVPLIFAPILSVLILFASLFGVALLVSFSLGAATSFLFGVVIYYLHYEWMHLGHHIPDYKQVFPWSNRLKTAHQLHHYRNENYWWGITNSIGDKVMGTYKTHKDVDPSKTIKNINYK
jgi:hypothetical protein